MRLAKLRNWTASELAAGLAINAAEVTRVLSIGKLSPEERQLARDGKLSKSAAYALSRMVPEERTKAAQRVATGQVTRDQLNQQARRKPAADGPKTRRVRCEWAGGSVVVQTTEGLTLSGLIDLLDGLMRECRKAKTQGLDIDTATRVLRDRSRAQPATANVGTE